MALRFMTQFSDLTSYEWSRNVDITFNRFGHAVSAVQEEDVLNYCQYE